jgi:hypothetical protein
MKLLENIPELEDDFEMMLSRKVSVNTEYDDSGNNHSESPVLSGELLEIIPNKVGSYLF